MRGAVLKTFSLLASILLLSLAGCKNPLGGGATSTVDIGHRPGSFSPPSAFTGSVETASDAITVSWSESSGANFYRVEYGTTEGVYPHLAVSQTVNTSHTISGLTSGQTYHVMVTAIGDTGESPISTELVARPIGTFTISSASKTSATSATLSWTSAPGASSYDILYGTGPTLLTQTASSVVSPATVTGLTSGSIYYARIRAHNTVGSGATRFSASEVTIGGAAPTISAIGLRVTNEDTATGTISFSVEDVDSSLTCGPSNLSLSSSNPQLIGSGDVVFGGVIPNCTAVLTPKLNQVGTAELSITVQDGSTPPLTATRIFTFNVAAVNDAPVLVGLTAISTNEDSLSAPATFTLNDVDSALTCTGALSGTSATPSVIATNGIVFGGTVPNCTVSVTPVANAFGSSVITVTATDGLLSTSGTFTATVNQLGDDPLTGLPWSFNNSTEYTATSGSDVNAGGNGLAQLIKADLIDDSTSGTGGDLDFSDFVSKSANVTVTGGKVSLDTTSASDSASTGAVYSGELLSRVIDGRTTAIDWASVSYKTLLPFGKEISIAPETDYGVAVTDFSANLMAHFRMNEIAAGSGAGGADIIDSKFGNNGTRTGAPTFSQPGILGNSIALSGTNQYFTIPDSVNYDNTSVLTLSVWFYPTVVDANPRGIVSKRVASVALNNSYSVFLHTGGKLYVDTVGTTNRFSSSSTIVANQWYHIAVVYNGSLAVGARTKLYLNGILDATGTGPVSIGNTNSNLYIGTLNDAYGVYFQGRIDEFALWKSAMSDGQVAQLYRRGSNRAGLQVRACDDITCVTGAPSWVGPDGTGGTYFNESRNTADGSMLGAVSTTPFDVLWTSLKSTYSAFNTWSSGVPFGSILNIRKRFVQYRLVLESFEKSTSTLCNASNDYAAAGTRPCVPEVLSVQFTGDRHDSTAPTVYTKSFAPDLGVEFYSLTSFTPTYGSASCLGDRYQLGLNGTSSWYYHNGTSWVDGTDYSTASSAAVINSNISTFPTIVGRGKLYVRAFLASDGTTGCEIDSIAVGGQK